MEGRRRKMMDDWEISRKSREEMKRGTQGRSGGQGGDVLEIEHVRLDEEEEGVCVCVMEEGYLLFKKMRKRWGLGGHFQLESIIICGQLSTLYGSMLLFFITMKRSKAIIHKHNLGYPLWCKQHISSPYYLLIMPLPRTSVPSNRGTDKSQHKIR